MDDVWFRFGEDKYYEEMKEYTLKVLTYIRKFTMSTVRDIQTSE